MKMPIVSLIATFVLVGVVAKALSLVAEVFEDADIASSLSALSMAACITAATAFAYWWFRDFEDLDEGNGPKDV
jgi:O-antigen/teichoic acid export membrane protein